MKCLGEGGTYRLRRCNVGIVDLNGQRKLPEDPGHLRGHIWQMTTTERLLR